MKSSKKVVARKSDRLHRHVANRLIKASAKALENLENRVLMSSTLAAWDFDTLPGTTSTSAIQTSPATTSGTGTAYTLGMQSAGNGYAYPVSYTGAPTADASTFLAATGTADSGGNGGSEGGTNGFVWRVESGQDNAAPIGSQGVQFSVPTTGDSGITVSFDMNPSSTGAEAQFAVEYTTDVNDASPVWTNVTSLLALGSNDAGDNPPSSTPTLGASPTNSIYIQNNTSSSSIISGDYATITGPNPSGSNTSWLNDLTVSLPSAANNSPNFAFRVVNAGTGTSEGSIANVLASTTPTTPATFKNWRFNDINFTSTGGTLAAPTIVTNPTSQTVAAGQPVTFTAAASGNPTPTVQWYEGTVGSGTLISGATSPTYTFTTSTTASDNGTTYYAVFTNSQGSTPTTAATLNDPLAAPVVITQPASVSTTAGSSVTFTSTASGSPVPTEGWQVSTGGSNPYTAITSGVGGYTISGNTLSFTTTSAENGYKYEAVFTNSQAPGGVDSNPATLGLGGSAIATWNFSNGGALVNGQTDLSPGPSVGTGTSTSLGMGSAGTYSLYPGTATSYTLTITDSSGSYTTGNLVGDTSAQIQSALQALHPTTTGSISVVNAIGPSLAGAATLIGENTGATLTGSGNGTFFVALDAQATTPGLTSSQVNGSPDNSNIVGPSVDTGSPNADASNVNAWRIVGHNGWNSNAPIGTQGAQLNTSTAGYSSIEASFDLYATSAGEAKMQVEYTADGTTWTNVPAADLSVGTGDTNIAVLSNNSSANTVQGGYFDITGGGSTNLWYNNLGVNLSGIAGVNNDANFGIRIVNASTGADCVNISGAALNNTSGNDRLGDIQITGNNPVAPTITTQPVSVSTAAGTNATFTAAAYGYPAPTVQWGVSTNGGTSFVPDTTDTGNTTTTLTVAATPADSGYEYEAIFSNSVSSTTSTAATLSVGPQITTNPTSQTVIAGATNVTLIAAATGTPTPTIQWEVETPGSTSFTAISGATSATYTIPTATEGVSGNEYEAVFTNSAGSIATSAATLTVTGTPIAQWDFTGGEAPPPGGSTTAGTGNSPSPTFGPSSNTAGTLGLQNDYTGIQAYPESDILIERSTLNPSYSEYDWRVRSGNGGGPTGSPGTPPGWSQDAPQYNQASVGTTDGQGNPIGPQGVQFNVNTTGYSNITFQFDWNQGGISDMQPQYSPDGGTTWINAPSGLIQQTGKDFYGITNSTTTAVPIVVNLQSIAAANNNPNFEFRLVTAWANPTTTNLPNITDGNGYDSTVHGQYATGAPGAVNAQQNFQFNSGITEGESVPLSYTANGVTTTASFTYTANVTNLIANMTAALNTLVGSGNFTVAPTNYTSATESYSNELQPVRDGLGNLSTDMTVTFGGTLKSKVVPTIATTDTNATLATWVNGSTAGFEPYVDGGGAWQIGNISFNGQSSQAGGLAITTNPASTTGTSGYAVTFTAAAYSETAGVTAQWYDNGNPISGATNISRSSTNYTSTYTFDPITSQNGDQITCVFIQGSNTVTSQPATLTVVAPSAPIVVIPPFAASAQAGNVAVFTSTAQGSPSPTIQWQINRNDGNGFVNLTNSATVSGATSTTLDYTTSSSGADNGDLFRAVFTNAVNSVNSVSAALSVLSPETILTDWDFNALDPTVSATGAADPYINSPAPVAAGIDNSVDIGGTASALGMTLAYNPSDPATGTNGQGSFNADDVVNSPGSLNTSFNENTWRVRAGTTATAGGTPANGWSNLAAPYTQGAQFSVPTTGYADVYVTMDWYSTTSGELDAQPQYTLDGTHWINLGNQVQAVSNDFYGATSTGGPIPLTFDVSQIAGADNNPNFGIRLVNAYDPYLSNTQSIVLGDTSNFQLTFNGQTTGTITYSSNASTMAANVQAALAALTNVGTGNVTVTAPSGTPSNLSVTFGGLLSLNFQPEIGVADSNDYVVYTPQYANAALVGSPAEPAPYNGSKGNWRFDNIVFHGDPSWLSPTSTASWNASTETLTVTGPAKIDADPAASPLSNPAGDSPIITASGSSAALSFNTGSTTGADFHIGGLSLTGGASATVTSLGTARTAANHNVLVIGSSSATTAPTFNIDPTSTLDLTDNDLIDLYGTGSTPLSTIQGDITQAADGGLWDKTGLTSSVAAAAPNTYALGYGEASTLGYTSFDGITLGGNAVLVKYTLVGDANLDGTVNFNDFSILQNNYGSAGGWSQGDFNYDGSVNFNDFSKLQNNYGQSLS